MIEVIGHEEGFPADSCLRPVIHTTFVRGDRGGPHSFMSGSAKSDESINNDQGDQPRENLILPPVPDLRRTPFVIEMVEVSLYFFLSIESGE